MLTLSDYLQLDAAGIASGTTTGHIKPTEVAALSLERAETVNKELHAFTGDNWEQEDDITIVGVKRYNTSES